MEHPAVQILIGIPGPLVLTRSGKTLVFRTSNISASRKKLVTLIKMSWYRASSSERSASSSPA